MVIRVHAIAAGLVDRLGRLSCRERREDGRGRWNQERRVLVWSWRCKSIATWWAIGCYWRNGTHTLLVMTCQIRDTVWVVVKTSSKSVPNKHNLAMKRMRKPQVVANSQLPNVIISKINSFKMYFLSFILSRDIVNPDDYTASLASSRQRRCKNSRKRSFVAPTSLMELVSLAYAITMETFCKLQTSTRGKRTELWPIYTIFLEISEPNSSAMT